MCVCLCFGLCEKEKEGKNERQYTRFMRLLSANIQPAEEDRNNVCTNFKLVQLKAAEPVGGGNPKEFFNVCVLFIQASLELVQNYFTRVVLSWAEHHVKGAMRREQVAFCCVYKC